METNWHVLTGGPNSGKSTLIEILKNIGHSVVSETAREVIGQSLESSPTTTESSGSLQERIFKAQVDKEARLRPNDELFMDRAAPDSKGYNALTESPSALIDGYRPERRYRSVFFCEPVPLQKDGLRSEDMEWNDRVAVSIRAAYEELGYEIVVLHANPTEPPARNISRRLVQILSRLRDDGEL